jgi:hypothetical protein
VVTPGRVPTSTSIRRTHTPSVFVEHPILGAIDASAAVYTCLLDQPWREKSSRQRRGSCFAIPVRSIWIRDFDTLGEPPAGWLRDGWLFGGNHIGQWSLLPLSLIKPPLAVWGSAGLNWS